MGIGWIDNIYNNDRAAWYLKSVDDRNNGAVIASGTTVTLDGGEYHPLKAGVHYEAKWCGVPWYFEGRHFKVMSRDRRHGVLFYASELEGRNWIVYQDLNTGRPIAQQEAPHGSDFHCNLRFEANGAFIDVVNNNAYSGENAVFLVMSEAREWLEASAPIIAAAIDASARGE